MDTNLQRQKYQKFAFKIELPTNQHVFSVMLHENFMDNKRNILCCSHYHIRYEIQCCWEPEDENVCAVFRVIPPNVRHTGKFESDTKGTFVTTFQFYVQEIQHKGGRRVHTPNEALEAFLKIGEPVEFRGTSDSSRLLKSIRQELEKGEQVNTDHLYFVFQELMVRIAQAIGPGRTRIVWADKYSINDFAPEVIEIFFVEHHPNTDCSREQLAEILCVSGRQLSRILERLYGRTFSQMLTEYRMEFAEGWRQLEHLTAEENARRVGYQSRNGFLKAYRSYYGRDYKRN